MGSLYLPGCYPLHVWTSKSAISSSCPLSLSFYMSLPFPSPHCFFSLSSRVIKGTHGSRGMQFWWKFCDWEVKSWISSLFVFIGTWRLDMKAWLSWKPSKLWVMEVYVSVLPSGRSFSLVFSFLFSFLLPSIVHCTSCLCHFPYFPFFFYSKNIYSLYCPFFIIAYLAMVTLLRSLLV